MDYLPKTGIYSHDITAYLLAAEELKIPPNQNFLNVLTDGMPICDLHGLDDINLEAICRVLKANAFIKSLKLSHGTFTIAGITHLADAIGGNSVLCRLDLRGCAIGAAGAKALGERLGTKGGGGAISLEEMDLSNTQIGVEGLEAIVRAVGTLPNFSALHLEDNNLPAQAGLLIGKAVRSKPGLEQVYLARNSLGDCGAAAIGGAIAADTRKGGRKRVDFQLSIMDLSQNELGCEGLSGLLRGLATLASISRASFHESHLQDGSENGHSVGSSGTSPPLPLKVMRLKGNLIADSGASKLAEFLRQSGDFRIDELDLAGNNIGEDGVGALCSALGTNPPLTTLDISACQLGSTPLRSLGSMLGLNSCLTSLNISPSRSLQRALADASQIQQLHSAFSEFVAGVEKNSTLTSLEVGELGTVLGRHPGLQTIRSKMLSNQSLARVPKAQPQTPASKNHTDPAMPVPQRDLSPMSAFPLGTPIPNGQQLRQKSQSQQSVYQFPDNHQTPQGYPSQYPSQSGMNQSIGTDNSYITMFSTPAQPHPQHQIGHMQRSFSAPIQPHLTEPVHSVAADPNSTENMKRYQEQQALLSQVSSQLETLLSKSALGNAEADQLQTQAALQSNLKKFQTQLSNQQFPSSDFNPNQSFNGPMARSRLGSQTADDQSASIIPMEPIPSPDQVKRMAEQAAHKAVEKIYEKHLKVAEQMLATEVDKINSSATKMGQELRWVDEEGVRKRLELEAKLEELGGDLKTKIDKILSDQKVISERLDRVEQIVGLKNGEHLGSSDLQTLSLRIEKLEEYMFSEKQKQSEGKTENDDKREKERRKVEKIEQRLSQLEETCVNEQEANLKVLEALLEAAQKK